jgi:baculoviral IAP repeat-containing protein 6
VEPLPFTLAHERCICVVQKLALFLLSMDFTCHADLLLFVCKVAIPVSSKGVGLMDNAVMCLQ